MPRAHLLGSHVPPHRADAKNLQHEQTIIVIVWFSVWVADGKWGSGRLKCGGDYVTLAGGKPSGRGLGSRVSRFACGGTGS